MESDFPGFHETRFSRDAQRDARGQSRTTRNTPVSDAMGVPATAQIPPYPYALPRTARRLSDAAEYDLGASLTPGAISQQILSHISHISIEPYHINTTFLTNGYIQALKNRLIHSDILPGNRLDTRKWVPTFVYDIMMFPGSLARILGKATETDLIDRLTPAILPGFRAVIDPISKMPALVPSPSDFVRGIVIFGQGTKQRNLIHEHFQEVNTSRVRPHVCIETMVPQPRYLRKNNERFARYRTTLRADTWVWADRSLNHRTDLATWQIEDYISGAYFEYP